MRKEVVQEALTLATNRGTKVRLEGSYGHHIAPRSVIVRDDYVIVNGDQGTAVFVMLDRITSVEVAS